MVIKRVIDLKKIKIKFIILLSINIIVIVCLLYIILKGLNPVLIFFIIAIFILMFILYYGLFCKYTSLFPLNNTNEFQYNPKKSALGFRSDGNYTIEIMEKRKGIWITKDKNEKIKFDMSGCIFPKVYICTYFIRNIHYDVINKNKYPLKKLFKSLDLSPVSKFNNVILRFEQNNNIKDIVIVKNNKSKVSFLMKQIIQSRYGILGGRGKAYNSRVYDYEKINEKIYNNEKKQKPIFFKKP